MRTSKLLWFCLGVVLGGIGRPLATHAFYWAVIIVVIAVKFGFRCAT